MKHNLLNMTLLATLVLSACAVQAPPARPQATTQAPAAAEPTPMATATAASEGASTPQAPGALPDAVVTQLDAFLQALVYKEGSDPKTTAPGLILLVDTPKGRYLNAAGVASLENGTPMKADDRVEIGSNTKSLTIVLLLQLQEEGVLSLDDPLSKWLPEWAAKIPNGDQMTLRQLAQHTSGIWDYGDPIIGAAASDPAKLEQGYTPEELVQYAIDNGKPDFAPDEAGKWKYSNTGYILLGMILEKATGKSLSKLYKERIFDPLGLKTAALIDGVPKPGEIVNGYWWTEDGKRLNSTNWNASQGWAAGAIAMTAEELMTYAKALSAGKLFKNPDTLAQMLTFDPNAMQGMLPYGLGLFDVSKIGAPGSWGHEGQTAGFQTLWFTNPETGITVVGLSNSAAFVAYAFANVAGIVASAAATTTGEANAATPTDLPPATISNDEGGPAAVTGDVIALEKAYGSPSQSGFGSAVFYEHLNPGDRLEEAALAKYKYFVGDLWSRYGEAAWMKPWKEVYARKAGQKPDIVAELRGINDPNAHQSVPMILDNIEGAEKARAALAAVYDDPAMTELRVFTLGDGAAISGLLIAGRRADADDATFLVFLLD